MSQNSKSLSPAAAVIAFLVMIVIELWLASAIMLAMLKMDANESNPLLTIQYLMAYPNNDQVVNAVFMGHLIGLVVLGFMLWLAFSPSKESLHGDSRFAKKADIKKAGLLDEGTSDPAILLGKFKDSFISFKGQEFVMVSAPTRSGKGVGIVVPNLLNYNGSVVCTDIKLENFELTSGFRAKHSDVYLFCPLSKERTTHRWNPYDYITDDPNLRIDQVNALMNFLVPTPADSKDPMWTREARKLAVGMSLFLLDCDEFPLTLGELRRQIMPEVGLPKYITDVILKQYRHRLDPECIAILAGFSRKPSKTAEGILGELEGALELWGNPLVDAATSTSDFDFRDLRKKRISLYIGIEAKDLERMERLLNLFMQQLIEQNLQSLPPRYDKKGTLTTGDPSIKHSVLLCLDEFAALGRLTILEKGVAFIAGYGLRMLPIFQSMSQLRSVYGNDVAENLEVNHCAKIHFAARKQSQAEEIANELGFKTVKSESKTIQVGEGKQSKSVSEAKRHLLLPQDIKQLPIDDELIIVDNCPPIYAQKIRYFKDSAFTDRVLAPVTVPVIDIIRYPTRGQESMIIDDMKIVADTELDFSFSDVEIDQLDQQSQEEIIQGADDFYNSLLDKLGESESDNNEIQEDSDTDDELPFDEDALDSVFKLMYSERELCNQTT